MTVDEVIIALSLIQDMENDKKVHGIIKDYGIESVTKTYDTSANMVCVLVREIAFINASYFYFVDAAAKSVYNVVFPGKPHEPEG